MINESLEKINLLQTVVNAALVLIFGYVVLKTYLATRALVPVLLAGLTGVAAIWIVNHSEWFQTKLDEDLNGAPAAVVHGVTAAARTRLGVW